MAYLKLLRPKDWAKNLFLFIPFFFSGDLFNVQAYPGLIIGFICFCFVASSIYIINDYRDIEDDRRHPVKKDRPLASGAVSKNAALIIAVLLILLGFGLGYFFLKGKFVFILALYFTLNLGYSFGLKNIAILDIFILSIGFVLRIKAGGVIASIPITEWLNIMVFLLALFMSIGKRRDDVALKIASGQDMRKSVKGYNMEYLNVVLALVCAVIVVAYFMYTLSPQVILRMGTYRLYYTCLFVLAGILRYLQIIFVKSEAGSPTSILYKDRFIQLTILLWIASFYIIIYTKDTTFFR